MLLAIALLLGIALVSTIATRSDARADIVNYLTGFGWRTPNSFEPAGHYTAGTAAEIVTNRTGNWTVFSNMGNLGIGNGSTATFGDPANPPPSNYSDYLFQAGDVSQQPLDPVRELNLPSATAIASNETSNVSAGNDTAASQGNIGANINHAFCGIRYEQAFNNTSLPAVVIAGQPPAENATAPVVAGTAPPYATPENVTFAAYHPIWAGRPVNDLLYEHPLAPNSISTYCRLVGLEAPAGPPVNIAMRCLSYGY